MFTGRVLGAARPGWLLLQMKTRRGRRAPLPETPSAAPLPETPSAAPHQGRWNATTTTAVIRAACVVVTAASVGYIVETFFHPVEKFMGPDKIKIRKAVNKFMEQQPDILEMEVKEQVLTAQAKRLQDRVEGWGKPGANGEENYHARHATILSGLFWAGKTTALRQALAGTRGVFKVQLYDGSCEAALFESLGVTGEDMFRSVVRRVTEELQSEKLAAKEVLTRVPLLIVEIPYYSKVDMRTVAVFTKAFAGDMWGRGHGVHVLVVTSSATAALSYGFCCRYDIWMEFSDMEAMEYLRTFHGITKPEIAAKIVELLGTNPVRLSDASPQDVGKAIEEGKDGESVVAAVSLQYRMRVESEVALLLAMPVPPSGHRTGREIAMALEKEDPVRRHLWKDTSIDVLDVVREMERGGANAIYYHTERHTWHFVSRLHRDEARKRLKKQQGFLGM